MASLKYPPKAKDHYDARRDWRWVEGWMESGHAAYFLRVGYRAKPIAVQKLLTSHGTTTEWVVYAMGGLVGVCAEWEDAMNLVDTTLTLLEAPHG